MMDLTLHKNKYARGYYWHKSPHGLNVNKAKQTALKDISGSEKICYLSKESSILKYLRLYNEPEQESIVLSQFDIEGLRRGKINIDSYFPPENPTKDYDLFIREIQLRKEEKARKHEETKKHIEDRHQQITKEEKLERLRSKRAVKKEIKTRIKRAEDKSLLESWREEDQREASIAKDKFRIEYSIANRYSWLYADCVVNHRGKTYDLYYVTADYDLGSQNVDIIFYFYRDNLLLSGNRIRNLIKQYANGDKSAMNLVDKNAWGYTVYRLPVDEALKCPDLSKDFMIKPNLEI